MKIVGSDKKNGALSSVTVELTDDREVMIYRKFFDDEAVLNSCPYCKTKNDVNKMDPNLRIDSPLSDPLNMCLATPVIVCSKCSNALPTSMMDYRAFPSVVTFIKSLRGRANEMKGSKNG